MRIVALLMLLVAAGHFNRVGISGADAERMMQQYKLSRTELGQVYSAFLLWYTLAMRPGGWLLDRFGSALFAGLTGCVGLASQTSRPTAIATADRERS